MNIEFKESWRDEYLKWLYGFANAQGESTLWHKTIVKYVVSKITRS